MLAILPFPLVGHPYNDFDAVFNDTLILAGSSLAQVKRGEWFALIIWLARMFDRVQTNVG